jgi:nucleoside-diphosphate-sugar epimerase
MITVSFLERVAVTGASGFIGSHLVRALALKGCRLTLISRAQKESSLDGKIRWVQSDLTDSDSIGDILQREKPATLFHLAGTRGRNGACACEELNFRATAALLEAARLAGVRRVVIAGSAEEYGNQPGPLGEALPSKATTAYGISKARATAYALEKRAREGCPVTVVRPFSVYGPGQPADMFIAEAVNTAVRHANLKMSRGEQKRDLIFVEDVVSGLIAAATAEGIEGKIINLGTGRAHRLRDVAERIWEMAGARGRLLVGARATAPDELYDTWADVTLAERLLGWEARTELESGLRRCIDFAREQLGEKAQQCQAM